MREKLLWGVGERAGTQYGEEAMASAIKWFLQKASPELALPLANIVGIVKSSS